MWLILLSVAALAAAAASASAPRRCPVTGAALTAAQLADPSLRVGDDVFCCKNCVKEWLHKGA
jgi:hypothetical protein